MKSSQRYSTEGNEEDIDRLEVGNYGDHKSVGNGVFELRLPFGPGYRIYFGEVNNTIVLLLTGGDKTSQSDDINKAVSFWQEFKEVHK